MSDWINAQERLPPYGDPVIVFTGVVQNTTFFLDASDEEEFGWWECVADSDVTIPVNDVTYWQYLPEPPK